MKERDKSRLLSATKPSKPSKRASAVGSYRERLDWNWVCARVRGAGVPESDVDDVAQIVVIAMSRAEKKMEIRPGQTERDARRATMRKIIRYRVATYRRDKARFFRMRLKLAWSADTEPKSPPTAEELSVRKEECTALHAALERMRKLAGAYQVAILYGLEETPMEEAAQGMRVPQNTAWSRWKRAKEVMRELLGELGVERHPRAA